MHRPPLLRLVALVLASACLTVTALPARPAAADQLSDQRAQAAKLAAELDADNRRLDSLSAKFEAAQLAASKLDAQVAAATAGVAAARRRIVETQGAVRDLAIGQYIKGEPGKAGVDAAFGQSDLRAVGLAQLFAHVAVQKGQAVLDASKAAQEDLQASLSTLHAQQQRAHEAAASLASARSAASAAAAQAKAHLGQVQGQLATLVAAEQARQQAAREARTRAAVAQQAGARSSGATRPAPPVDASRAAAAVAEARRQLGKPYEWGAAGPDSFDCSGLTMWAWRAAGVHLDHYSGAQYDETTHISLDQLQPGDLVFFYRDLSHVGIYVGNGQMIHAPHTGDVVRYGSIYAEGSPIYAGRVTG